MPRKIKRAVYRFNGGFYYKYCTDDTCYSVEYQSLFNVAVITRKRYDVIDKNAIVCKKREFIKHYRKARKEIRL